MSLQAGTPASIYVIGILLGTEKLQLTQAVKVLVVCMGVGIASHGDLTLTLAGFLLQAGSIVMDALRCCFLQKVLQHNKVDATPLVTIAYVAPFSAAGLLLPMALVEGSGIIQEFDEWKSAIPLVCLSGLLATVLNFLVFKIIRLTSALTTSLSGVIKEWVCILVAMSVYGTAVTATQWLGYTIAICGLVWYNVGRIRGSQQALAKKEEEDVVKHYVDIDTEEHTSVVYVKVQRH